MSCRIPSRRTPMRPPPPPPEATHAAATPPVRRMAAERALSGVVVVAAAAAARRRRRLHGALARHFSPTQRFPRRGLAGRGGPRGRPRRQRARDRPVRPGLHRSRLARHAVAAAAARRARAPSWGAARGRILCGGVRARRGDGPCRPPAEGGGARGRRVFTHHRRRGGRPGWGGGRGAAAAAAAVARRARLPLPRAAHRRITRGRAGLGPGQAASIAAGAAAGGLQAERGGRGGGRGGGCHSRATPPAQC